MAKLFETTIGDLEYLLLGLTFLGVMYLVMKQANYTIKLQRAEGYNNLGPGRVAWAAHTSQGFPSTEGFSNGANEPPVWNSTPFDPDEHDPAVEVGTGAVDLQNELDANTGAVATGAWGNRAGLTVVSVQQLPKGFTLTKYSNGSFVKRNEKGEEVSANNGVFTQTIEGLARKYSTGYGNTRDGFKTDPYAKALAGYSTSL